MLQSGGLRTQVPRWAMAGCAQVLVDSYHLQTHGISQNLALHLLAAS